MAMEEPDGRTFSLVERSMADGDGALGSQPKSMAPAATTGWMQDGPRFDQGLVLNALTLSPQDSYQ